MTMFFTFEMSTFIRTTLSLIPAQIWQDRNHPGGNSLEPPQNTRGDEDGFFSCANLQIANSDSGEEGFQVRIFRYVGESKREEFSKAARPQALPARSCGL